MPCGEFFKYKVLRMIGILILIHQDIIETGGYFRKSLFVVAEENIGLIENIIKVHHARLFELVLIEGEDFAKSRPFSSGISFEKVTVIAIVLGIKKSVFYLGDTGENILRLIICLVSVFTQSQFFNACSYGADGIGLVVDGKVRRIAQTLGVWP